VPLHTVTARAAITLAAITGAATIAIDGHAAADAHRPAISRYLDIEANKASSMRALGIATMQNSFASPYRDLEANKACSAQAR
jgi:hypothetical protein